jgi:hypothetical protein
MSTGTFQESEGVSSSNRLIFVIGSIWAMAICTYLTIKGIEPGIMLATFSGLEGVFIGLKLGQKAMENKTN